MYRWNYFFAFLAGSVGLLLMVLAKYAPAGLVGLTVAYLLFCVGQRAAQGKHRKDD
jgi:hypothetical protein